MHVEVRHHGDDVGLARIVAQRDHSHRQPKQRPLGGLAGPAVAVHVKLKKPLAEMGVPHHREVVLQTRTKPHDVGRVPEEPGRPPLVMQWGNSAANEIGPNHLRGEPGHGEAMDLGSSDRELLVVGIGVAPVLATDWRALTNSAELLRILLDP